MRQGADSKRHSQLDEKKTRAAGRRKERARAEIRQAMDDTLPRKLGAQGANRSDAK